MKLEVEVGFNGPKYAKTLGILDYKHNVTSNSGFSVGNLENQAYALRIIHEEFKAVIQKVNDRLKAEGYDEYSFRKILPGCDEYGNVIDVMEKTVC